MFVEPLPRNGHPLFLLHEARTQSPLSFILQPANEATRPEPVRYVRGGGGSVSANLAKAFLRLLENSKMF